MITMEPKDLNKTNNERSTKLDTLKCVMAKCRNVQFTQESHVYVPGKSSGQTEFMTDGVACLRLYAAGGSYVDIHSFNYVVTVTDQDTYYTIDVYLHNSILDTNEIWEQFIGAVMYVINNYKLKAADNDTK